MKYNNSSFFWSTNQDKKPWAIERSERRICFGNPAYIDEWVYYSYHDTEEEAKKELDQLEAFVDPLSRRNYRIVDTRVFSYNVK